MAQSVCFEHSLPGPTMWLRGEKPEARGHKQMPWGLCHSVSLGKDAARWGRGRLPAAWPTLRPPLTWLARARTAGLPGGLGPLPPRGSRNTRVRGRGPRAGRGVALRGASASASCALGMSPTPPPPADVATGRGLHWYTGGWGGPEVAAAAVCGAPWLVRGKQTASRFQVAAAGGSSCDL